MAPDEVVRRIESLAETHGIETLITVPPRSAANILDNLRDRHGDEAVNTALVDALEADDSAGMDVAEARDRLGGGGGGGTADDAGGSGDEGQSGLGGFGGGDGRRTGRVTQQGGVGELDSDLDAVASGDDSLPASIKQAVEDRVRDALGSLAPFVPEGTDVASFVWSNGGDPTIESVTVSYDPVNNPPQDFNDFNWRGNTTPMAGTDHDIAERYSFCGPPMAGIRTEFTPFERDEPVEVPSGSVIVQGPTPGTIKPHPDSPLIQTPAGQVVGIDQSVLRRDDLCLWVEVQQSGTTGDWTVVLDVRGESEERNPPRVGVDAGIAGGIPPTRTGAFAAAFELMAGNSPSGIFTDVVETINRNPEVAAKSPDDEEQVAEDLEKVADGGGQGGLGGFDGDDEDDGPEEFGAGAAAMSKQEAAAFVRELNRRGDSAAVSQALEGRSVSLPTHETADLRDAINTLGEERAAQIAGVSLPDEESDSAFTGQQSLGQSTTQSLTEFGQGDE